jgi:hypothetical protein
MSLEAAVEYDGGALEYRFQDLAWVCSLALSLGYACELMDRISADWPGWVEGRGDRHLPAFFQG